jgi:hypothetical protein
MTERIVDELRDSEACAPASSSVDHDWTLDAKHKLDSAMLDRGRGGHGATEARENACEIRYSFSPRRTQDVVDLRGRAHLRYDLVERRLRFVAGRVLGNCRSERDRSGVIVPNAVNHFRHRKQMIVSKFVSGSSAVVHAKSPQEAAALTIMEANCGSGHLSLSKMRDLASLHSGPN